VDLGTAFTAVASAAGPRAQAEMVSLGMRSVVVPSVVFASGSGRLLSGEAAARGALDEPRRSAREFKRRLGDPTPLILGDTPYSPARLMAAVLGDVVAAATQAHGEPPATVVLSRPAVWGPYRREQFEGVPRLAGLTDVHMVAEPVAAAAQYVASRPLREGALLAVYDLGGGTFDATVLRSQGGGAEVLGDPAGVEWLGGSDFDEAILHYVDGELDGTISGLDPRDDESAAMLLRIREECVLAKEALSFDERVTVPVFLKGEHHKIPLTRARFEQMIRPMIDSTIESLVRTIRSAGIDGADLDAVLLVGGSSRIPLVAGTVEAALGRPTVVNAHPKHLVALGAARLAARIGAGGAPGGGTTAEPEPPPGRSRRRRPASRRGARPATGPRPGGTDVPLIDPGLLSPATVGEPATSILRPETAVAATAGPPEGPGATRRTFRDPGPDQVGRRAPGALRRLLIVLLVTVVVVVVSALAGILLGYLKHRSDLSSAAVMNSVTGRHVQVVKASDGSDGST
jgi:molecular chaperone DnaK